MDRLEFAKTRRYLAKTQNQLSRLLCVSPKAIQSFEQGWRNVPVGIERQLLLLSSLKANSENSPKPCWEIRECPLAWRENCTVWEYKARQFCWFVNGTFCQGRFQESWKSKMTVCRQCEVFRAIIPADV